MINPHMGVCLSDSQSLKSRHTAFFRSCDLDFFVNVSGRVFMGDKDLGSFCDYEKLHFHNYYKKVVIIIESGLIYRNKIEGELSRNSTSNVEAYDRNSLRNLAPGPEKKKQFMVSGPGDFSHQNFLKIQ